MTRAAFWSPRAFVLLALAACSGAGVAADPEGDAGAPGAGPLGSAGASNGMPCDVAEVVTKHCGECHGESPRYGAPMPLATAADFLAPAKSEPGRRVKDLVAERTHGNPTVMPPSGPLPDAELAKLDAWLAAGAPASDAACASTGTPDAGKSVGPAALPCTPDATFLAHGGSAGAAFKVPTTAGNLYQCFAFKVPFKEDRHGVAFAPIVGDARVLHHWILYATKTPQTEGASFDCAGKMPTDAIFVTGWAPGKGNTVLPPDIGQVLPKDDQWFILQTHYHNVAGYDDALDASGVAMCTTKELRAHPAQIATLGTPFIDIPARTPSYETTGTCRPTNTEPVHLIGAGPHMHQRGTSLTTKVLRGGDAAKAETVVDVPRWDFEAQTSYPASAVVNPGDTLTTTCRYSNPTDARIRFGERTEDEMCFNFVLAWPAGALVDARGSGKNRCIGF